jgi:hypothetical protein
MEVAIKAGIVAAGVILLAGSGCTWYRAKWLDLNLQDPDGVPPWSSGRTRHRLLRYGITSVLAGLLLVLLTFIWMGNR